MPAMQPVPNVVSVVLKWADGSGAQVGTKQFMQYSGDSPSGAACLSIATDLFSAMSEGNDAWGVGVALQGVKVTDLSSDDGGEAEYVGNTVGTISGSSLPASVALLVNYTINRRYRGGKPRNYFPWGGGGSINTPDQWNGGFLTTAQSALAYYFAQANGTTSDWTTITDHVNVSYYQGFTVETPAGKRAKNVSTPRTPPLVNTITSFGASARIASQRRRIPRT